MEEHRIPTESRETTHQNSLTKAKRSYIACERCHKNKTKCNGENPCRNCRQSRKPVQCVYPIRDRKVPVVESYLKTLEEENKALKRKRSLEPPEDLPQGVNNDSLSQDMSSGAQTPYYEPSRQQDRPRSIQPNRFIPAPKGASVEENSRVTVDEISLQPRYMGEASSETFGGRLRRYINRDDSRPLNRPYNYYKTPQLLRISCTDCNLPNKNYARLLVRAVLRFIGGDHHLLLRQSFLKRLDETYQLEVLDDPVWLCRLFTVLALGELYSARGAQGMRKGEGVPGTKFFVTAMTYFQDMHEEPSVSYIETLLLLSFYSVALNRRNTAYTYTGIAMRLALTLGLHRRIPKDSGMSAPEREHRVRVWWTCYALDRIYTSKIGLPIMLRDEDIDVQMPSMDGLTVEESEDFYTPELMTAQIKLARITGNVMSDLYRIPQPGRTNTFVQSVQRILTGLRNWHETLPQVLRLDFDAMPIYPSRSVASLHLHFGNAVIQTTRPILFHLFRSHFDQAASLNPPRDVSPITSALGEACIQAARTSSSILAQLWVDGCLAPFGFFDALSVFASTMILMMSSAMKDDENNDNDAVETAWSLLRSMKEAGNIPAHGYFEQLTDLKVELDSLTAKRREQQRIDSISQNRETRGLQMLLAASGSVAEQVPRPIVNQSATRESAPFGVGDAMGALDDPFLQDFLQQTYGSWSGDNFATPYPVVPAVIAEQLQFDWENANIFDTV